MSAAIKWPRIRDLPEQEREPFAKWLYGQTRPLMENGTAPEDEDAFYQWDYDRWKAGLPIID